LFLSFSTLITMDCGFGCHLLVAAYVILPRNVRIGLKILQRKKFRRRLISARRPLDVSEGQGIG